MARDHLGACQVAAPAEGVGEHRLCAAHISAACNDAAKQPLRRVELAALDRRPRRCIILAHAGASQRLLPTRLVLGVGGDGAREQVPRLGYIALAQPNQPQPAERVRVLRVPLQRRLKSSFRLLDVAAVEGSKPGTARGGGFVNGGAGRIACLLQARY